MRYVQIYDIRELRCWRNKNSVLLYYYICIACNYKTRQLNKSLRRMAQELQLTLSALRHSLKVLESAGLISVDSYGRSTVITIPTKFVEDPAPADPLAELRKHSQEIAHTLSVTENDLFIYFDEFIKLQKLARHTWSSTRDLLAHFASWYMKNANSKILQNSIKAENLRQQREVQERIQQQQQQQMAEQRKNAISYQEYQRRKAAGYYDNQQSS